MANPESITQAEATSEYFTMVMRRKPVRLQTRTAEKTTKKLSPSARAVKKFARTKYLSQADVGGRVSSAPVTTATCHSAANRMTHTTAATCVVHSNQRVPGCGAGCGRCPGNIRLAARMIGASTTASRMIRLTATAVSTGFLYSYQATRCACTPGKS